MTVQAFARKTAAKQRNDILEPIVRSYARAIGDAFILMQDNARDNTRGPTAF